MNLLNDLIEKMVDEAPVEFTETQLKYVRELAKTYAYMCGKATLEVAGNNAQLRKIQGKYQPIYGVNKESITDESNIKLL